MTTVIDRAGFEVWFTIGRATCPTKLLNGLSQLSNNPPYVPEQRTKLDALQFALTDACREASHDPVSFVVRPLADRQGRHVWRETKGVDRNDLVSCFTIRVPDDTTLDAEGELPPSSDSLQKIQILFDEYLRTLSSRAVKTIMVKEILRLCGTKIDGKDAYFLPPESIDEWRKVVNVCRNATVTHDCKFYEQKYELNGSALEAVQVSIEDEITESVDDILEELTKGKFTDRVAKNRLHKLQDLTTKMQRYEALFDAGLEACQYKIKEVLNAMNLSAASEESTDVFDDVFDVAT